MAWKGAVLAAAMLASLLGSPDPASAGHLPLQESTARLRPSTVSLTAAPVSTLDGVSSVWLHLGETVRSEEHTSELQSH